MLVDGGLVEDSPFPSVMPEVWADDVTVLIGDDVETGVVVDICSVDPVCVELAEASGLVLVDGGFVVESPFVSVALEVWLDVVETGVVVDDCSVDPVVDISVELVIF